MGSLPLQCATLQQQTKSLADYLPNGKVFESKNIKGQKLHALLMGLAQELVRIDGKVKEVVEQYDIENTTELIEQWEMALGIPDGCFSNTGDIEDRRRNVLIKLASSIGTLGSFYALALELGYSNIEIVPASDIALFPLQFPITFGPSAQEVNFTVLVHLPQNLDPCIFPIPFPVCFEDESRGLLECLFRYFAPANVRLIFIYDL